MSKLKSLLFAIVALNIFDGVATLKWIELGFAKEANPLMAPLIAHCPSCFLLLKFGIVTLACLYLWSVRDNKYILTASKLIFIVYSVLAAYHMIGFCKLFGLLS
jgi:uncharacterized membrane protein YqjE